jgi:hypothetical protein
MGVPSSSALLEAVPHTYNERRATPHWRCVMRGLMQDRPLLLSSIAEFAESSHGDV